MCAKKHTQRNSIPECNQSEEDNIRCLQRQNEQLVHELAVLKSIIATMPNHIFWKNREGVYLGCNDAQAHSLGLNSGTEVIGKTDKELSWKEGADNFRTIDLKVMERAETISVEEHSVLPNGKAVVFYSTKKPLYNPGTNNIIGVIGISVDITEFKKLQTSLIKAKEQAELANQIKSAFIHNMEHDIRTPLSGIFGLATILLRHEKNTKKKDYLEHMVSAAKELLVYCNTILDFSKAEFNQLPVVAKTFDLFELIKKVIDMEMVAAEVKNIRLDYSIENVPQFVIGDDYRMTRILLNLISNAIKFTPKGYVNLNVSGYSQKNKKIILKFIFEDSGIGIPEEKQQFIGEKFIRLSSSNKGRYKGLGLGIPVVKQFIHDLHGQLELKSEVNKGSTFTCIIPFELPLLTELTEKK